MVLRRKEGLKFNTEPPTPLNDGQIEGNPLTFDENPYAEGSSVISDDNGNLLFYSDGERVWNSNHEVMPNGHDLAGMYSSTNPAFIIPMPGSDSLFYVFTTDGLERNLEGGFSYSLVDMCLDNGWGDIVASQKNIRLLDLATEKIAAVSHSNGVDIWVIAHKYNSDQFYAYLVTENGIMDPVVTAVGSVHTGIASFAAIGAMQVSTDGRKLALNVSNISPNITELFDFNDLTGVLSNPILLEVNSPVCYGLAFSSNSNRLYVVALDGIFQFNLELTTSNEINLSKTLINPNGQKCAPRGMQLGPDGKIYVRGCGSRLDIIHQPNLLGLQSEFEENAIGQNSSFSLPSFIAGYKYNNGVSKCILPENNIKLCMDGNDNDGDGDIDCNDEECVFSTTEQKIICRGEVYQGYELAGTYIDTLTAISGCDSIRTLFLEIQNQLSTEVNETICMGESYEGYQQSGTYIDTFLRSEGCDSFRILNLEVLDLEKVFEQKNICTGESYKGFEVEGIYFDTITSLQGCDTILEIELKVFPNATENESVVIDEGESYSGYTESGIYKDTLTSNFHCHVIRILDLKVNQLYIPNTFSPNNDGVNDLFKFYSSSIQTEVKTFKIFDRWGNLLLSNPNEPSWDGTFNGTDSQVGTYHYLIEVIINEKDEVRMGTVTLIR